MSALRRDLAGGWSGGSVPGVPSTARSDLRHGVSGRHLRRPIGGFGGAVPAVGDHRHDRNRRNGGGLQARQRELDRVVALKILPPGIGDRPGFAERFTREAKALAKLSHPGIVTIYDIGRAGGLYYLLMEYVDGVNLRQLIQAGRISPAEALAIVPQICDALQYAHDEGDRPPRHQAREHPARPQGRVKIADFGMAKMMGADERDRGEARPRPRFSPRSARSWARRTTWRRSRSSIPPTWTTAPTSTRWASSSTRC